jgi:hypothetical protein
MARRRAERTDRGAEESLDIRKLHLALFRLVRSTVESKMGMAALQSGGGKIKLW